MANPEHVAKLREDVEAWNAWRQQERYPPPDLSGAVLRGLDLSGADLAGLDLGLADLRGAKLAGAYITRSTMPLANLSGAALTSAILHRSRFRGTDLSEADFTGADLSGVVFIGTNLGGAILSQTTLAETIFIDTGLGDVIGLESSRHAGPSSLDHRTLMKSGVLPQKFLRGVGLPDALIEYLPSLLSQPVQYYSCFISYSTADQAFADRLHADLQDKGVRCWFAPHDMKRGQKIHEQIDEAIRRYDKLLLILSESSMNSNWVRTEIANARARERDEGVRMLFPITLVPFDAVRKWKCFDADTGIDSAREIREYLVAEFSRWKEHDAYVAEFEKLVRDLKAEL